MVLNKMNELLSIAFYTIVAIQSNFSVLHESSASYMMLRNHGRVHMLNRTTFKQGLWIQLIPFEILELLVTTRMRISAIGAKIHLPPN